MYTVAVCRLHSFWDGEEEWFLFEPRKVAAISSEISSASCVGVCVCVCICGGQSCIVFDIIFRLLYDFYIYIFYNAKDEMMLVRRT